MADVSVNVTANTGTARTEVQQLTEALARLNAALNSGALDRYASDLQKVATGMDRLRQVSPKASETRKFIDAVEQQANGGKPMPTPALLQASLQPVAGFDDKQREAALRNIRQNVFAETSFARQPSSTTSPEAPQVPDAPPPRTEMPGIPERQTAGPQKSSELPERQKPPVPGMAPPPGNVPDAGKTAVLGSKPKTLDSLREKLADYDATDRPVRDRLPLIDGYRDIAKRDLPKMQERFEGLLRGHDLGLPDEDRRWVKGQMPGVVGNLKKVLSSEGRDPAAADVLRFYEHDDKLFGNGPKSEERRRRFRETVDPVLFEGINRIARPEMPGAQTPELAPVIPAAPAPVISRDLWGNGAVRSDGSRIGRGFDQYGPPVPREMREYGPPATLAPQPGEVVQPQAPQAATPVEAPRPLPKINWNPTSRNFDDGAAEQMERLPGAFEQYGPPIPADLAKPLRASAFHREEFADPIQVRQHGVQYGPPVPPELKASPEAPKETPQQPAAATLAPAPAISVDFAGHQKRFQQEMAGAQGVGQQQAVQARATLAAIQEIKKALEQAGMAGKRFAEIDWKDERLKHVAEAAKEAANQLDSMVTSGFDHTSSRLRSIAKQTPGGIDLLDIPDIAESRYRNEHERNHFLKDVGQPVFATTPFAVPYVPGQVVGEATNPGLASRLFQRATSGFTGQAPVPMAGLVQQGGGGSGGGAGGGSGGGGSWGSNGFFGGMASGAGRALGFGGMFEIGQRVASTAIGVVKGSYNDARQEAIDTNQLGKVLQDTNTDFNKLRDAVMGTANALHITNEAAQKLSVEFAHQTSGRSTEQNQRGAQDAGGFAKGFGLDEGQTARSFGRAQFLGTDTKQFAAMIAEASRSGGMSGQIDKLMDVMGSVRETLSRQYVSNPNAMQSFSGLLGDMSAQGRESGVGPQGTDNAGLLQKVNATLSHGGGHGQASRAYMYRMLAEKGITNVYEADRVIERGGFATIPGTDETMLQGLHGFLERDTADLDPQMASAIYRNTMVGFGNGTVDDTDRLRNSLRRAGKKGNSKLFQDLDAAGVPRDKLKTEHLEGLLDVEEADAEGLKKIRGRLLARPEGQRLSEEDQKTVKGLEGKSVEEQRKALLPIVNANNIDTNIGQETKNAEANLSNRVTEIGRAFLEPVAEIKSAGATMLSASDKFSKAADKIYDALHGGAIPSDPWEAGQRAAKGIRKGGGLDPQDVPPAPEAAPEQQKKAAEGAHSRGRMVPTERIPGFEATEPQTIQPPKGGAAPAKGGEKHSSITDRIPGAYQEASLPYASDAMPPRGEAGEEPASTTIAAANTETGETAPATIAAASTELPTTPTTMPPPPAESPAPPRATDDRGEWPGVVEWAEGPVPPEELGERPEPLPTINPRPAAERPAPRALNLDLHTQPTEPVPPPPEQPERPRAGWMEWTRQHLGKIPGWSIRDDREPQQSAGALTHPSDHKGGLTPPDLTGFIGHSHDGQHALMEGAKLMNKWRAEHGLPQYTHTGQTIDPQHPEKSGAASLYVPPEVAGETKPSQSQATKQTQTELAPKGEQAPPQPTPVARIADTAPSGEAAPDPVALGMDGKPEPVATGTSRLSGAPKATLGKDGEPVEEEPRTYEEAAKRSRLNRFGSMAERGAVLAGRRSEGIGGLFGWGGRVGAGRMLHPDRQPDERSGARFSGGSMGGGAPHKLAQSERAKQAMEFFQGKGWSKEQSAGLVANLIHESGLRTEAKGDGGVARGLAQWHPDRQAGFAEWAGKPLSEASYEEQLGYVHHELTEGREQAAGKALAKTSDAAQAAAIGDHLYERSSGTTTGARMATARSLMGNPPPEVAATPVKLASTPTNLAPEPQEPITLDRQGILEQRHAHTAAAGASIRERASQARERALEMQRGSGPQARSGMGPALPEPAATRPAWMSPEYAPQGASPGTMDTRASADQTPDAPAQIAGAPDDDVGQLVDSKPITDPYQKPPELAVKPTSTRPSGMPVPATEASRGMGTPGSMEHKVQVASKVNIAPLRVEHVNGATGEAIGTEYLPVTTVPSTKALGGIA